MADNSARKITDGRVGDQFQVTKNFNGNFGNAVGVPMQTPRGKAYPIPPGDGPVNTTVVTRPDFRRIPKNAPVHNN
ncbi:Protein CBG26688 [Caenorhabditis briggsae]|uniref:Protein CBG26688 n=1 Tax=Caenorhabditis briggsae TaxID=6238 RepID=B6IE59_CAEBR|nr:Protein CBG26688 [Caenorhabditis briggsae]CAS01123.1 Protein CBG26688 [Caenorhabditis briggsae]